MAEATTQAMDVDAAASGSASGALAAPTSTPPTPMSLAATGDGNGVSTGAPTAPTAPAAPTSGVPVVLGLQASGVAGAAPGPPTAPQPPAPPIPPQQVSLPQPLGAAQVSNAAAQPGGLGQVSQARGGVSSASGAPMALQQQQVGMAQPQQPGTVPPQQQQHHHQQHHQQDPRMQGQAQGQVMHSGHPGQGPVQAGAPSQMAQQPRPSPPAWYDPDQHINERRKMVTSIAKLLQQRKPNAPTEWMKKLPQMARRLEESLFRGSPSFDEYKDENTLKKRLQKLALDMGIRARENVQNGQPQPGQPVQGMQPGASGQGGPVRQADINPMMARKGGAMPGNAQQRQSAPSLSQGQGQGQGQNQGQNQQTQEQRQQVLRQQQQRLLLLRHASKCPHGELNMTVNQENHNEGARVKRGPSWKWGDQDGGSTKYGTLGKKRSNGWTIVTWEHTRQEREYRIGSENAHDLVFGGCPVTQHCASMKKLWKHIAECKDQQCQVPHCVSSRYVLSHYHRCRERGCAVCQPVREAIQRNHEKAKELENLRKEQQKQNAIKAQTEPTKTTGKKKNVGGGGGGGGGGAGGAGATGGETGTKKRRPSGKNKQQQQPQQQPAPTTVVIPNPPKPQVNKKPDPTTSYMYSFSSKQIEDHISCLAKPRNLKPSLIRQKCIPVLKRIMESEYGWIFNAKVDPVELNLPDYFTIVTNPMDLGNVKKKLENGNYQNVNEFTDDVRLVFDNAMLYNGPASDVSQVAKNMKKTFEGEWKKVQNELTKEEEDKKASGDACALCGSGVEVFAQTSYYCNGSCNGQRIRRNSYYYTDRQNKYHWCHVCYGDLKDGAPIDMAEVVLQKADLIKKKNDEQHEEPWVGCDECQRWVHQICALFNGRKNQGENTVYHCPFCVLDTRKKLKMDKPTTQHKSAKDIEHTQCSTYIETRVRTKLATEVKRIAETEFDGDRSKVEVPGRLHVRQLSNLKEKMHRVKPRVLEKYKDAEVHGLQGFPEAFPVTSKCIVLFEEIEGVDVLLFGMYLYEYGHKAPQPNHRRVYVSYLDSVHYFRPKRFRTLVYHEMLVAYLAYVKARGFHTCHIWACPPCKGDDYIFFCHPEEQKTPKEDRLRNWYITMLQKCQDEGTVVKLTTLFDEHFKDSDSSAVKVPYFEGDYWIAEAEAILKALEDEKEQRTDGKKSKQKKDNKSKDKANSRGLRSDGDVEELNGRDPLVVRMGKTLESMRDAFIVAHLHDRDYADRTWQQRLKEIEEERLQEEREASGGLSNGRKSTDVPEDATGSTSKTDPPKIKAEPESKTSTVETKEASSSSASSTSASESKDPRVKSEDSKLAAVGSSEGATAMAEDSKDGAQDAKNSEAKIKSEKNDSTEDLNVKESGTSSDKPAAMKEDKKEGEKKDGAEATEGAATNGDQKEEKSSSSEVNGGASQGELSSSTSSSSVPSAPVSSSSSSLSVSSSGSGAAPVEYVDVNVPIKDGLVIKTSPNPEDDTEDVDNQIESEFFDTRQQFLNLCQGNHYQFDSSRRAKHTSMMALYHIHNPDIPKFVMSCSSCGLDIMSGYRYDCEQCPEFHLCQKCHQHFTARRQQCHNHPLKRQIVQGEGGLTNEQKKQRARSIQLHMQLLAHASICQNPKCPSANCEKMKNLLGHGTKCQVKVQGGCNVCRRIWALLQIHARQCRKSNCQVPKCRQLKEQLRAIENQQAAMDERRRQAMNEQYQGRSASSSSSSSSSSAAAEAR